MTYDSINYFIFDDFLPYRFQCNWYNGKCAIKLSSIKFQYLDLSKYGFIFKSSQHGGHGHYIDGFFTLDTSAVDDMHEIFNWMAEIGEYLDKDLYISQVEYSAMHERFDITISCWLTDLPLLEVCFKGVPWDEPLEFDSAGEIIPPLS